ncbi:error-prone DNA polymerase [Candidatus Macondimonas diazotrophica]|uniref:Error-prone DNA polymerase n=1 Tax=Candidatus Macondimonas diazotrophica TaxID=2305248 RepID=A0A4Z0FCJ7_9GAMM|nr:error-prone DNA polymerase [Candidatus Macondimonas diazotrophica]TFZ83486.1 error-prone DNA polymerase [Candidatus Macondimonas diazotrophica]
MSHARFAELHCVSSFTFLRGASHPEELVARAAQLGYRALALTDECSVAGVVRAHRATRDHPLHLIIGSEFTLADGLKLVLLCPDRAAYAGLCGLITRARQQAGKGDYRLDRTDLANAALAECLCIWLPGESCPASDGRFLQTLFAQRLWIGASRFMEGRDRERLCALRHLGETLGLPIVACNDVHMHRRSRKPLQDVLTAIRLKIPLQMLGTRLQPNAERHLRSEQRLATLYPAAWLEESVRIAERCRFSLDELQYEYPAELVPAGQTPTSWLRELTESGAHQRWPAGVPAKIQALVDQELALIAEMRYEPFFLTVQDLVRHARSLGILCQGRGSAANSAVCYCLGITEVDPNRMDLLFGRFISRERNEPPDIDVDFEHERREEIIQYIYAKYGRHRAALAASVITYQTRSAIRDVGKALGMDLPEVERLTRTVDRLDGYRLNPAQLRANGYDPGGRVLRQLSALVNTLVGFPRHLSQHVGGFVIAAEQLSRLVPVENAAMAGRTVIQWDKDDLESLGLLKVDVLALGMLTAIRKTLAYVSAYSPRPIALVDVPAEDPAVYDMLSAGDSVGVFQVESRAQMSMLPRLKPRNYYDLVVQIAIVRPGPIQGQMVHPYLARRAGREPVSYPSAAVRKVLDRTLGVPIFQEQVMQLAMVAAGFSAGEADQLRRAMGAWHAKGRLEQFEQRLLNGMTLRGYRETFARQIIQQIRGFGEYGFPESHSASFALLAYVSAWLKRHHPAAFCAGLLNAQPMGFYAPAQLVRDARQHGVTIRPIDADISQWDATVEGPERALRLGLRLVKGLPREAADRLIHARRVRPYRDLNDLARRARLSRRDLESLAAADALRGLTGHRHEAYWQTNGIEAATPLFEDLRIAEAEPLLRTPSEGESIVADHAASGLSLRRHPIALLRARLERAGACPLAEAWDVPAGNTLRVAGLVICRQQPGTAKGVTFVTLEDETGQLNLIVWRQLAERQRSTLLRSTLLLATGTVQQQDGVLHLVASHLQDFSAWLGGLTHRAREFH